MAQHHNFKVKNGLDVGNSLTVDSNATITGTLTLGGNTVDSSWVKARADSDYIRTAVDSDYIRTAVDSAYVKTVQYLDNESLVFGTGNDFSIRHNGTNNVLSAASGVLSLQPHTTGEVNIWDANDANYLFRARALQNDVQLYNSGTIRLQTTTTGATVTGEVVADSATISIISVPDGTSSTNNIRIGSSDDLRLFHNGTNSYVYDNGTGGLHLVSNNVEIRGADFARKMISATDQGAVEIYDNNSKKFETTSTGVTVTGTMNADSSTMTNLTLTGNLQVDGTQTIINSNTLSVNDKNIVLADSATNAAAADSGGITLNGANAKILYRSSGDKWEFNKAPYYNSARLITTDDNLIDSSLTTQLIDSAYVQARQTEGATRGFAIAMSIAL